MNQGCVGRGNAVVFSRAANPYISDSLSARFLWSFLAGVFRTSTICSSASLLSDMWLPGGDDAASLLPSCGPASLHACVILGVYTLFCERTLSHSHTHTHPPFSDQIRPRLNFRHGQPPNTTNMEDAVDASPGEKPKAFKSLLGILEKYVT